MRVPIDVDGLTARLRDESYLADRGLATALACAVAMQRPLLLEGDAGVGKTEAARALARVYGAALVRLQCYDGLDLYAAAYDWNYAKQLLAIRTAEASGAEPPDLYAAEFLLRRPLLSALDGRRPRGVVLLIDEIDRADDEFEAYLLEYLADFAMTIPEFGRVQAAHPPIVILTSNRTRDLHDALKRRCFYYWIGHPSLEREVQIIQMRLPHVAPALARGVAGAVAVLRERGLRKAPGIAEALDWTQTLDALGADRLERRFLDDSLGSVVKYPEDLETARAAANSLVS